MTTQYKFNLVNPYIQNLFLLSQNERFINDIDSLRDKFSIEIESLKKPGVLNKLLQKEIGSKELLSYIDSVAKKSDLYKTPDRRPLYIVIILSLLKARMDKLWPNLDLTKKALINSINWDINSGPEGTALIISLSNFHSKTDLVDFIDHKWPEVEKARQPYKKSKIKLDKPKPYTDFARDWQMFLDKNEMSYTKLAKKYNFNEVNSVKIIISKLRRKITSIYSG